MSDDCPGEGKCHGPMKWCDECGDVGDVCDAAPPIVIPLDDGWSRFEWRGSCHAHYCTTCFKKANLSDMTCEACDLQQEIEKWEDRMLNARSLESIERARKMLATLTAYARNDQP